MRLLFSLIVFFASFVTARAQVANFTVDYASGCAPHVVHFANTSTGATSYSWDLGNGIITPLTSPSTSYLTVGTFTVTLTAYNGTSSSVHTMVITVHPLPSVNFTASDTTICPGTSISFTNFSTSGVPGPMTYSWNFGDGGISSLANPSHVYSTSGYYNVTLSVTNSQGCVRTYTKAAYIQVYTPPVVVFAGSPLFVCNPPGTVTFSNFSTGAGPLTYLWNFGSGPSSTLASPSNSYTTPGVFTVKLVVTDGNGCKDSLTRLSYINVSTITAAFTNPATACLNTPVAFTNTSSTHGTRTWNYGDATGDTTYNGAHAYTVPGTYTVTLTIMNGPCTNVVTHTITVLPHSTADFTIAPANPCPAPATITYTGTAPAGSSISWLYEGGATGSGSTGTHTYGTNGVKTIKMIVTSAAGCIDTVVKTDTLYDLEFYGIGLPMSGCVPLNVHFNAVAYTNQPDSSTHPYPYLPLSSFVWNFGDGSAPEYTPTTSHTYTAVGIYIATVTATTANGCYVVDTMKIAVGSPPAVTFTATPLHLCYGGQIDFTATIVTGPVSTYEWNFGDDVAITSSPFTSHVYSIPGIFTVTLTPYYNGCPGLPVIRTNYITVDSPKAIITYNQLCSPPNRIAFFDSSMGDDTHLWMFGDGTTSTLDNPVHDYPAIDTYTVTLTTYNILSGCRDTAHVFIDLHRPTLSFVADDTTICLGEDVHFTSSITGGTALSYRWYINGYTDPSFTYPTLTDTFNVPGLYTVILVIENHYHCFDTLTKTNYVVVGKPNANFTGVPIPGCWPLTVTFTDASTDVPTLSITGFEWNFGDGGTAIVSTPVTTHTYTLPGTYSVSEIVTDNIGCKDTVVRPSYIIVYKPHAVFSATNIHPCIGVPITFNNISSGIVSSYWTFGDGSTSTATSPVHSYSAVGTYTVKLVVTDVHGCTDTAAYINYITVTKPTASFLLSDTFSVCAPLLVVFTNTSTGAATYNWTFGDGNISTFPVPTNMYISPGFYNVQLIARDAWGCTDTATNHVNIYGYAGALTYAPLTGCTPLLVNFSASISNVPHIIWDFGDGSTSVMTAVDTASHVYTIPGAYVPKLILSDATGCQNSSMGIDTIKVDAITAKFDVSPAACIGSPFNFVDSSTWFWMPIDSWVWTYGSGMTSTLSSPTHQIDIVGSYPVTLTVSNAWGCTATLTDDIIVHPLPVVYTSPDTVVCVGDPATLTGYGAQTYSWGPPATLSCINCNPTTAIPMVISTYSVIGTDEHGCKDTSDVLVGLRTHTFAHAWGDSTICSGMEVPIFDTGGTKYTWSPGGSLNNSTIYNPLASPASATIYTVIAQLAGCIPDTDYVKVDVYSLPTVDAGPDLEAQAGTLVPLTAKGSNIASFEWLPHTGLSCYNCANPDATVPVTTTYIINVTSPYGCKASDSVTIFLFCNSKQVFVPNVFTPNADGENDVFYPRGTGITIIKSFRIYNRWGQLLFERSNINVNDAGNAWDGSYMGEPPKPDVYVYVIDAVCSTGQPVMIKGDVTIVR